MKLIGTRGDKPVSAAEAVVRGLGENGGLYVPETFPKISEDDLSALLPMSYPERAAFVIGKFFGELDKEELLSALEEAYSSFEGDPAPLVRTDSGMYILELFHGPTCAFKDMALAVLPYLLKKCCEETGVKEDVLVLAATSGDTGKAALEGFKNKKGVKVAVFYPDEGVSKMQKLQMGTTEGDNVNVVAVRGSFDDCQRNVKKIFASDDAKSKLLEKGVVLSSANSINFGRIVPQIAYYISAYCDLLSSDQISMGEKVDFAVPAGNFGNLLSAYYAMRMGLPVGTLVCASNRNNVLFDFFTTGRYDCKRPLFRTMSPSMDILVSSNLERLVFEFSGRDVSLTAERMRSLAQTGRYSVTEKELSSMKEVFFAGFASEDDTVESVYDFFEDYGYPMDPHTGVAMCVAGRYEEKIEKDPKAEKRPIVVVSTASPYKFPQDVLYALTGNDVKDSYKGVKRIHLLTAMKVPESLKAIRYKPILFKTVISPDKMLPELLRFLSSPTPASSDSQLAPPPRVVLSEA